MRSIAWQVIPGHFQLRYFGVKECLDVSGWHWRLVCIAKRLSPPVIDVHVLVKQREVLAQCAGLASVGIRPATLDPHIDRGGRKGCVVPERGIASSCLCNISISNVFFLRTQDASVSRRCQNLHKGRIAIGAYGSPEIESFALCIELRPDEVDRFPYISFDFRRDRSLDPHFKIRSVVSPISKTLYLSKRA